MAQICRHLEGIKYQDRDQDWLSRTDMSFRRAHLPLIRTLCDGFTECEKPMFPYSFNIRGAKHKDVLASFNIGNLDHIP